MEKLAWETRLEAGDLARKPSKKKVKKKLTSLWEWSGLGPRGRNMRIH